MPILICFLASLLLTLIVTAVARRQALFDVPNGRSSHTIPTPRLGGIAVFVAFTEVGFILSATGHLDLSLKSWSLLLGSFLLFSVGLLDDLRSVSWQTRCAVQALAVTTILAALSGIPLSSIRPLAWLGFWPIQALALIGGIWIINVFNFMDGIDGIAGAETIFICLAGGALWAWSGDHWMATILWLMAAAVAGFLISNWPPAKIFLGDCGSGVLGFVMAFNLLFAMKVAPSLFWPMLILPCVFIADATVTVIRRMARRQKWYAAHRSHAYQHAATRWGHLRTTLGVVAVNLFWTLPLAYLAFSHSTVGPLVLLVAFIPLVALALRFNAGSHTETR